MLYLECVRRLTKTGLTSISESAIFFFEEISPFNNLWHFFIAEKPKHQATAGTDFAQTINKK